LDNLLNKKSIFAQQDLLDKNSGVGSIPPSQDKNVDVTDVSGEMGQYFPNTGDKITDEWLQIYRDELRPYLVTLNMCVNQLAEVDSAFNALLGSEETKTEGLGSTQGLMEDTSGLLSPEEMVGIGNYGEQIANQALGLIPKITAIFIKVASTVAPGQNQEKINQVKTMQRSNIQKIKFKAAIFQKSKSRAILLSTVAPYQRNIDILKPKFNQIEMEWKTYSEIGTYGQNMYPLFLMFESYAQKFMSLYMGMIQSLSSKRIALAQAGDANFVKWVDMQIQKTQMKYVQIQLEVQEKRKSLIPQEFSGQVGTAAFNWGGGPQASNSYDNIRLSEEDDDTIFRDADKKLKGYFNDLLSGYGTILEKPWKYRKKRIKFKLKK
jgi:hypothetical protein